MQHGMTGTSSLPPLIVVIDDEFTSRIIIDKIVRTVQGNAVIETFQSPLKFLGWMHWNLPDLILIDLHMKEMSGLEVIQAIRQVPAMETVPVVVITSDSDRETRYAALDVGATDFMIKPVDPYECRVRCRNLLAMRQHEKALKEHSMNLERSIFRATQQIREREQETLYCLAKAGEFRDSETGNHILRMAHYSRLIAEALDMDQAHCELIEKAAPMHDIGKIGIPDQILLKPGRLTEDEYLVMKNHPMIGYKILKESPSTILNKGALIALGHHEKFDGSGYPQGLKGTEIPIEARIVAVADVYDALTSVRPYKKAWSNDEAIGYLKDNRLKHFDPDCVEAFMNQYDKVSLIQQQLKDTMLQVEFGAIR